MAEISIEQLATQKGLKKICWNVRSLFNKFAEFEVVVDKMLPDIICLNETWLCKSIPDSLISLDNYHLFRHDQSTPKKGGGLCIYSRKKLKIDPDSQKELYLCNKNIELQALEIKLPQTKPIFLLNTYRPPTGKIQEAIDALQGALNSLPNNAEIYLLGDLNVDISQKSSSLTQKLNLFEKKRIN